MQYIDKAPLAGEATQLIDGLLEDCWKKEDGPYVAANYETLSRDPYRSRFKDLLLREQKSFCCYCMKTLQNDHTTTIEHLIPQNASKNDFQRYQHENFTYVIHSADFDPHTHQPTRERYPHDIAYHNLIASCDSKVHCNNKRKDAHIAPLVYDPEIHSKIEYDRGGRAFSAVEKYNESLNTLGLSANTLKMYRRIWAELAKNPAIAPDALTEEDIEETILEMDFFDQLIENFFGTPSKKPTLLQYSWFFHYYRKQNKP